jgi:hypothetical protein
MVQQHSSGDPVQSSPLTLVCVLALELVAMGDDFDWERDGPAGAGQLIGAPPIGLRTTPSEKTGGLGP